MEGKSIWLQRYESLKRSSPATCTPRPVKSRVLRSLQLDAERLDEELLGVLNDKLSSALSLMKDPTSCGEELGALVRLVVFYCTVWRSNPTPGQSLLNLKYANGQRFAAHTPEGCTPPSQHQKALLGIGSILLPYAWSKLSSVAIAENRPRLVHHVRKYTKFIEGLLHVASLVNLLVFVRHGVYRGLLERMVGVCCVYGNPVMNRVISWEVLNRQLIWHEVSELLLSALPLLSTVSTRSMFPFLRKIVKLEGHSGQQMWETSQQSDSSTNAACPECGRTELVMPYSAIPCKHIYCYYCLRALGVRGNVLCHICGECVVSMQPAEPQT